MDGLDDVERAFLLFAVMSALALSLLWWPTRFRAVCRP